MSHNADLASPGDLMDITFRDAPDAESAHAFVVSSGSNVDMWPAMAARVGGAQT